MIQKIGLFTKLLTDQRFRRDVKAFKASVPEFVSRAWNLLSELGLRKDFEEGTTIASLRKKGIKNDKMLECMLDMLVGQGVLRYDGAIYYFEKEPRKITEKEFSFLRRYYPSSVRWADFVAKNAKQTLLTGIPSKITGFNYDKALDLWDGIMEESPYSFRVMSVKKLLSEVNENAKILDLGCGGGIGLETILRHAKKPITLVGADSSKKYLNRAQARLDNLENETNNSLLKENLKRTQLTCFDVTKGIPKDETYDAVFMSIVLNHVPENRREKLFKEINEALSEKGVLTVYQLIHQTKFNRNPICWLMHTVPSHSEYPFRDEHFRQLKKHFQTVEEHLYGAIAIAKK